MRNPHLKRKHISVDERELERWKKFAQENYHGLLSQAVRACMNDTIRESQDGGKPMELRPITERLDEFGESLANIKEEIARLNELVGGIRSADEINEVFLNAISRVLQEARRPLSPEAVADKLPTHSIRDVRRGLETLADRFVVEPLEQNGKTFWKPVGGENVAE